MKTDDIIRMARQAGLVEWMPHTHQDGRWWIEAHEPDDSLVRFAALVAAAEREACARECWEFYSIEGIAQKCNAAIRARGQQ